MFQSFDVTSTPQYGSERTQALRASFDTLGIDYLVQVPIGIALAIIAIRTANLRFHLGLVIAHLVYQVWWISILFYTHS